MLPDYKLVNAMLPDHPVNITEEALLRLEAVIFASERPVSIAQLKQAFENDISTSQIRQWLDLLAARQNNRAIELIETVQGFRFQLRVQYGAMVNKVWPDRPVKLSGALLETLAVIAYHQPVTRADIEHIRGVSVNSQILRTLFDRQWITESGYREIPGKPALLVTTKQFLTAFGLLSLDVLPALENATEVLNLFNESDDLNSQSGFSS